MKAEPEENEKERELPKLSQIYFYLTEGCNLACRHCWIAPQFDADGSFPSLSMESFETAVREAKPLGLQGVKLTGGEPLMHPHFIDLLEIVRRESLGLTIETNGLLCTSEVAAEIARSPNRHISVSIDGADAKTHEWIRGVPGSFERAKEAVRNLVSTGTRPQIIMTLMHRNAAQMAEVIGMAEALGASSVKFNVVQPTARGESLTQARETLGVEELIKLCRHMELDLAPKTNLPLFFDYPYAFRPLSRIHSGKGCGRCSILNIMGVISSGYYALCGIGYHIPEMVFGEVGVHRLAEIWKNNDILKALRSGLPQSLEGICRGCLMKHFCLGSCIAQNYYSTKNLWAPYWFCDQAHKVGLFPESRIVNDILIDRREK
ncbi:Coenzyme PQQ synthesis protein E [uncultured archaeon]|nr:Coenzyme PQQ synthesis protein E [uncultured archaeon]